MKKKKSRDNIVSWILSAFLCLVYLFPFYIILMLSFKPKTDLRSRLALPDSLYLDHYIAVLKNGQILLAMKNNVIIIIGSLLVIVVVGSLAAYPLARVQSKWNEWIRKVFMGIMMITPLTVLVGVYSILSRIGAISTYWGIILILSTFGVPMSVYLYANFIATIPVELDEAAAIDGAGHLATFFHVILPQLKPVTVTVIIMQGVNIWNNYLFTHYVLQKKTMFTVTQVVSGYFSTTSSDYGGAAAVAVIGMLPVVVLYLCLQKYFVQGAMDSAVK